MKFIKLKDIKKIHQDSSTIKAISTQHHRWAIGQHEFGGITKILPYQENGEMAEVTWLAIYCKEKIKYRIKASECLIEYKE